MEYKNLKCPKCGEAALDLRKDYMYYWECNNCRYQVMAYFDGHLKPVIPPLTVVKQ